MSRSTVHYVDNKTNNALKALHNKLRPAGTPVQRVEYIIELLLLRIFESKIKQDEEFKPLRELFSTDYKWLNPKTGKEESNENRLFSYLPSVSNDQILSELNDNFFPFYSSILHSARKVYKGNLPQKVQDQLVLIEEVFSNSNFTNNVNSGNLGEVINIVANEIEETRLLKTDLLGDAIESALSETGGTKDVGLFRTPDHVRQFMTALVEPTFDDIIFDPACGTGGFLFDAFEFVMRRVDNTREWPGVKAHSELAAWFDNYFESNPIEFPSIEQTTQFYRSGVTGVEYLGMIRKMAAINFYIRGLNPANIEQGDSLAKYRPVTDHETKSIILANPPFGAQRDQEAYSDVWSEYSKESETTILFVKLMFEHLKPGGLCAVVVSEGFHTWDQFSAKALRKMLLEEAQLKAVISLPQGLFVSKNGQGPKTSVLVFEKGGTTDWTWFYKATNDGYTMGTNRKEQKGNQLVECLNLWHEFIKHGKRPEETKNQFCIPSEWIKTLDPRIKEKIRTETRADMEAKGKIEKEKKTEDLDKKLEAKKITEADKQMELKIFDQMLENRIQNEIAKRIDKAHNYSFNFANYKSTISQNQIEEWTEALKHIQPNGATTLDEIYKKLSNGKPENSLPSLVKLNPANALEADIAREYINNLDNELILKHKELNVIKEILKSDVKYPMIPLKEFMVSVAEERKIIIDDNLIYKDPTISTKTNLISVRNEEEGRFLKVKKRIKIERGDFVIGLLHTQNGAFAFSEEEFASTGTFIPFKIDENQISKKYLFSLMKSVLKQLIKEDTTGRENYKIDDILELNIPLPSLDEQAAIVAQIEKQKAIIEGAEKVLNNLDIDFIVLYDWERVKLKDVCKNIFTGNTPTNKVKDEGEIPFLKINNLSFNLSLIQEKEFFIDKDVLDAEMKNFKCYPNDILMNIVGPPMGKVTIIPEFLKVSTTNQNVICFRTSEKILPRYLGYFLLRKDTINTLIEDKRGVVGQWFVNKTMCSNIEIPLPDLTTQQKIVSELDSQIQILEGLRKMKSEAERKIQKILGEVWGVESIANETITNYELSTTNENED